MDHVPFEQVQRVERALMAHPRRVELLTGLVAVFTRVGSDELLLMYVQGPPASVPAGCRAIPLDDVEGIDLRPYNGPVIGYGAIDIVRWDIPTKGSEFYRLDRLLRQHGHLELSRANMAALAGYLRDHVTEITFRSHDESLERRAWAEIAAIAAPA